MKTKAIALLASIVALGSATATVTLSFNSQGFLGEAGQTSGITWGVVVDAAGDGFDSYMGSFSLANNALVGGSDDDFLFLSPAKTINGGIGGLITNVPGVTDAEGRGFAVIWFDSTLSAGNTTGDTNTYGFYTQPSYVMPAPGASLPFAASDQTAKQATIALGVPEPSVAILGALGVLGLVRRRR